jgi:hypothetical protein
MIENVYRLQIMNTVVSDLEVTLGPTETRATPVRLRTAHGVAKKGSNKIEISLQASDDPSIAVREEAVFIVPR